MDYLVHIAYVIYLASYSVRDMLWLRALTIVASVVLLPYYYYLPDPLYVPMAWLTLFTLINVVQIVVLILERRPVEMSAQEKTIYKLAFQRLKPRQFLKLLKVAEWREAASGETFLKQGTNVGGVLLLISGRTDVRFDGCYVASGEKGHFVGEMSYLTDELASADVTAIEPCRFLFWPEDDLNDLLDLDPDLESDFMGILGCDLVAKINERNQKDSIA